MNEFEQKPHSEDLPSETDPSLKDVDFFEDFSSKSDNNPGNSYSSGQSIPGPAEPYAYQPAREQPFGGYNYSNINMTVTKKKKRSYTGVAILSALLALLFLSGVMALAFTVFHPNITESSDGRYSFSFGNGPSIPLPQPSTSLPEKDNNAESPASPGMVDTRPEDGSLDLNDIPSSDADLPYSGSELTIKQIAKKVRPMVIGIETEGVNDTGGGSGSGIIMREDGYILTNQHVIADASVIRVVLEDGRSFNAKIVGQDARSDVAVIKIDEDGLPVAEFGNSDQVEVGDQVVAIGNPMGLELSGTVTVGYISAINRDLAIEGQMQKLLQTDASINPGNSGGPLVNIYGQVIGIINAKNIDTEGLGFALPITNVKPIVDELMAKGYITGRPAIGITGSTISAQMAAYSNIPQGVQVAWVNPSSLSYNKILKYDIITSLNGVTVTSVSELNSEKEKYSAGETIKLGVFRDQKNITVEIVLSDDADLADTIPPA